MIVPGTDGLQLRRHRETLTAMRSFVVCIVLAVFAFACGDDDFNGLPDAPIDEDLDDDGVLNASDNCPLDANADQANADGDGEGDACDADDDNDGILDAADNCSLVANPDQANVDGDAEGDACDGDTDGDTIANASDNCPTMANTDQANNDGDAEGDVCDTDDDNDTIADSSDNCVFAANTDQVNSDTDADGDACDTDDDDDTVLDGDDNCPTVSNVDQGNVDEDAIGDACDADNDNDGVDDVNDNCPTVQNAGQENNDTDANGDACDDDDDDDGIGDEGDNCPIDANEDQLNTDGDAAGNACDADDDNDGEPDATDNCDLVGNNQDDGDSDGVGNACDNCPNLANAGQEDGDNDGIGNVCDGIFPTLSEAIVGGNMVAAGAAWSAREDREIKTQADITITGIPAGATIHKAFLYWTTIGTPFPTVTLEGTAVTGTEIGQAEDTCWNIGRNFMYRADVTSRVTGNDTYTLTNILSSLSGSDGQGASLVIIYIDPQDPRTNFVKVSDGAIGFTGQGGGSSTVTATIDGFTLTANPDQVVVFNLVADGQTFPETLTIQNTQVGGSDPFFGADGNLWDTRIDDVTGTVLSGATSVTSVLFSNNDCLAWSMNGVVIENFVTTAQAAAPSTPSVSTVPTKKLAAPAQTTTTTRSGGAMR
jgi:hypothetical protein